MGFANLFLIVVIFLMIIGGGWATWEHFKTGVSKVGSAAKGAVHKNFVRGPLYSYRTSSAAAGEIQQDHEAYTQVNFTNAHPRAWYPYELDTPVGQFPPVYY